MAIRTGISAAVIELAAATTDTVILAGQAAGSRAAVSALSLFNTSGANRDVEIYESPDNTSASGTLVATVSLAALESYQVAECIGQGFASGQRLIAVQTTGGAALGDVTAKLTYTVYTAGS